MSYLKRQAVREAEDILQQETARNPFLQQHFPAALTQLIHSFLDPRPRCSTCMRPGDSKCTFM